MSQKFQPKLPDLVYQSSGRRFVLSNEADRYVAELAGIPYGPKSDPNVLIPVKIFAQRLGVTVRTVERRLAEEKAALPADDNVPASEVA
jgi:hypothetical protein